MKENINIIIKKGLFHIIGSNFCNKIIVFIANIVLVRILSKAEFGIFTSAFNVFSVIFLFSGLGINNGMLYFCSQKRNIENKREYYNYCFYYGNIINLILSGVMLLYGIVIKSGISEANTYIILLAGMPIVGFWYDYYAIVLRSQKENKKYAKLLNINTLLYALLAVIGSAIGGITGTIVGRYIAYLISALIGKRYTSDYLNISDTQKRFIKLGDRKSLISYSLKAGMSSAFNNILYLLDVYIIGIVIANASILASYKVGAQIPENMNFIPQSIMVFILPLFIENANDSKWIKKKTKQLYIYMFSASLVISVLLFVMAPMIISVLWGKQYDDAVPCFRILSISFLFLSAFRLTSTNILLSLGKAGYTLLVSIASGILNIFLDVFLTIKCGSIGAAYATLIITIVASLLSLPYVIYVVNKKH